MGGWGFDGKQFAQKPEYTWRNAGFKQTDAHPVVNVSWNDAKAFCEWLSGKRGVLRHFSHRRPQRPRFRYVPYLSRRFLRQRAGPLPVCQPLLVRARQPAL